MHSEELKAESEQLAWALAPHGLGLHVARWALLSKSAVQLGTSRAWMARRRIGKPGLTAEISGAVSLGEQGCRMDENTLTKFRSCPSTPSRYNSEPSCSMDTTTYHGCYGGLEQGLCEATKASGCTQAHATHMGDIRLQQRVIQLEQSH